MKTNFIQAKDIKIAYYQGNSSEKSIIFLHGNSLSSETFKAQFEDDQFKQFNLLAIDFPGHGKSEHSNQPEKHYGLRGLKSTVLDMLTKLHVEEFIFAGHSLGGHIAIDCLPETPNCKGIIIWGMKRKPRGKVQKRSPLLSRSCLCDL